MLLAEDNHVIETLAANTTDDPFDVRALPRRARRRQDLLDAEPCNAPAEVPAVDLVAIPYSERCVLKAETREWRSDKIIRDAAALLGKDQVRGPRMNK